MESMPLFLDANTLAHLSWAFEWQPDTNLVKLFQLATRHQSIWPLLNSGVAAVWPTKTAPSCTWCTIHSVPADQMLSISLRLHQSCFGNPALSSNAVHQRRPFRDCSFVIQRSRRKTPLPMALCRLLIPINGIPADQSTTFPRRVHQIYFSLRRSCRQYSHCPTAPRREFCDSLVLLHNWSYWKCNLHYSCLNFKWTNDVVAIACGLTEGTSRQRKVEKKTIFRRFSFVVLLRVNLATPMGNRLLCSQCPHCCECMEWYCYITTDT